MGGNGVAALRQIMQFVSKTQGFDKCLQTVRVVSGSGGRCVFEMKVGEEHQNRMGSLHGGMTATLVDSLSTLSLMSEGGPPGVSVDLNVSFVRGAKVGSDIVIESTLLKQGKTLAFLNVDIKNKDDDKLIATGRHTKYVGS